MRVWTCAHSDPRRETGCASARGERIRNKCAPASVESVESVEAWTETTVTNRAQTYRVLGCSVVEHRIRLAHWTRDARRGASSLLLDGPAVEKSQGVSKEYSSPSNWRTVREWVSRAHQTSRCAQRASHARHGFIFGAQGRGARLDSRRLDAQTRPLLLGRRQHRRSDGARADGRAAVTLP